MVTDFLLMYNTQNKVHQFYEYEWTSFYIYVCMYYIFMKKNNSHSYTQWIYVLQKSTSLNRKNSSFLSYPRKEFLLIYENMH